MPDPDATLAPDDVAGGETATARGRPRALGVALFLGYGALAWFAASPWLDDRDGALFVSALERFSLAEHRPHPPGYGVYVLLGNLLEALVGDPSAALRLLGAIAAGVAAALVPAVLRRTGLAGARLATAVALTLCAPLFVLTSCKVLTDVPGLVVTLYATWVLARAPAGRPFLQGLLVGLGSGMRPHALLPVAPLLLVTAGRGPRLAGVALGVGLWIGGTMAVAGADSVVEATAAQAMHRFEREHVALFTPGQTLAGAAERAATFAGRTMRDVFGVDALAVRVLLLVVLALGTVGLWRDAARDPRLRWLRPWLVGAAVYALFLYCFLPPHPRYLLPLVPLLMTCAVRALGTVAGVGLIWLVFVSTSHVRTLHAERPPPESLVRWMAEVDPAATVPYVPGPLFPHVRVRAPARLQHAWGRSDHEPDTGRVFTDRASIVRRARAGEDGWHVVAERTFERDPRIHDKDATMTLLLVERR